MTIKKPRIFVICSGLGYVKRGYESFFRGCFKALCTEPMIDLTLFKGKGDSKEKEIRLWNIHRHTSAAKGIGKLIGRGGYFVEQITFFLALLPHLFFKTPDVIYVSDVVLGNFIRLLKKFTWRKYQVLFNNNGPVTPQLLSRWDHVQQVSPQYLQEGLAVGIAESRQTLLASAVGIQGSFIPFHGANKDVLREKLGLPQRKPIILSVGALNTNRKRMDYLIHEVASLNQPRPYLVLLGQREPDTEEVIELGETLLTKSGFCARTVAPEEVRDYYKTADLFALASLDEGFGLVYVEALSYGLPCLVHDYETSRFVLGEMGCYGDFTQEGALASLISDCLLKDFDIEEATARHAYAYENFSWDRLKPKYVELFQRCANLKENTFAANE